MAVRSPNIRANLNAGTSARLRSLQKDLKKISNSPTIGIAKRQRLDHCLLFQDLCADLILDEFLSKAILGTAAVDAYAFQKVTLGKVIRENGR